VPGTPDKGIILSRIPRTPPKHGKTSRPTIAGTGSTVAVAAVASATVSIWPAGAAEQQPAAAPQNSELQQAAGPAASSTAADLAATGAVTVADTTGGAGIGRQATRKATKHLIAAEQIGGKVLIFKLRFIVISWGLGYIRDLYGSPGGAWNHELATGSC
jgi:hypothetical protein